MPRGYRCILVAVVGWLSLAAQAPQPTAKPQQAQTAQAQAAAQEKIAAANYEAAGRAQRAKYEAQCHPRNEKRNSDLCAQWKAADAAASAAKWTKWGTWFSGLSGLLVIAALFLAFQSNRIARDTARRQLRAYLTIGDCSLKPLKAGEPFKAKIFAQNSGETPARNMIWHSTIEFRMAGSTDPFELMPLPDPPSSTIVGRNGSTHTWVASAAPLNDLVVKDISDEKAIVWIFGTITYDDIFGESHTLTFRHFYDAAVHGLCAAPEGNHGD